jgi:thiopurine S-methyltransferase
MDSGFWHEKWTQKELGFHRSQPNPLLVKHFDKLALSPNSRIFLPLCGKTRDISWLLGHGYRVVGSELVATAVDQLFEELAIVPTISQSGQLLRYSAHHIDIHVGDIFELDRAVLGHIDAIYDRAALVALPEQMRTRYAEHLMAMSGSATQLLITFEYDQTVMNGPPFAVDEAEVRRHYDERYELRLVSSTPVEGGLKGQFAADELVWMLHRR